MKSNMAAKVTLEVTDMCGGDEADSDIFITLRMSRNLLDFFAEIGLKKTIMDAARHALNEPDPKG
jgi:hypothetical protein